MKNLTREWLQFADIDINTARALLGKSELTPSIAFHCHQCLEKSFKAVLVEFEIDPPRIHNLLRLFDLSRQFFSVEVDIKELEAINETYIDARYPGDMGLLPEGMPSLSKVQSFYETAADVFGKVKFFLESVENP